MDYPRWLIQRRAPMAIRHSTISIRCGSLIVERNCRSMSLARPFSTNDDFRVLLSLVRDSQPIGCTDSGNSYAGSDQKLRSRFPLPSPIGGKGRTNVGGRRNVVHWISSALAACRVMRKDLVTRVESVPPARVA